MRAPTNLGGSIGIKSIDIVEKESLQLAFCIAQKFWVSNKKGGPIGPPFYLNQPNF
jgi:hypothetical protein